MIGCIVFQARCWVAVHAVPPPLPAVIARTWPPGEPAAVVIPNARDLFSAEAVLPTTAKIGPNPLPAIPKPINIFKNWCFYAKKLSFYGKRNAGTKNKWIYR